MPWVQRFAVYYLFFNKTLFLDNDQDKRDKLKGLDTASAKKLMNSGYETMLAKGWIFVNHVVYVEIRSLSGTPRTLIARICSSATNSLSDVRASASIS